MEEDWDYLIVLDACRYDVFREVVDEKANFAISGGRSTKSWMTWNFRDKYDDVIYIAGNPHFAGANLRRVLGFNPFYLVIEVWDFGWDDDLKTVPPEEVTKATLDTLKIYPEKNMIIHYLQPHHPFLSDKAIIEKEEINKPTMEGIQTHGLRRGRGKKVWELVMKGEVPIERAIKGYKENLKIVWKEVEKLNNKLQGKIIVTSDHGNLIGEYGMYGHGGPLRAEHLVKVPWTIIKDEKKIYEGEKPSDKKNIIMHTRAVKRKIKRARREPTDRSKHRNCDRKYEYLPLLQRELPYFFERELDSMFYNEYSSEF